MHNFASKFETLDEMEKFPEKYNLSKLALGKTENLNRLITAENIEKEKLTHPMNVQHILGRGGSVGKFYQLVNDQILSILFE